MRFASVWAAAAAVVCVALAARSVHATPLDDFLALPDPVFGWEIVSSWKGSQLGHGYTVYAMNLTSTTWLTPNDTNAYIWYHWVNICVPDKITNDKAFMYIDGGHTGDPVPTSIDEIVLTPCLAAGSITVHLMQIPNEPIYFTAEGKRRSEDAIIAYTWKHFIDHPDEPFWLLRMPMVKASVKCMDAVQQFIQERVTSAPTPTGFVVAGASKRGWTTWLVGAVDKRVFAIVPIVLDVLNMIPNIGHQWECYGNWSFALDDYLEMGLMAYLNTPSFVELAAVVDPYSYRDRLKIPKYMICATGDEFFLPDSPKYFWNDLVDPKWMYMVPDCEHSIAGHETDVILSATTYFMRLISGEPLPTFTWEYHSTDGNKTWVISATAPQANPPTMVRLWHAHNPLARDFRLITNDDPIVVNPVLWLEQDVPGKVDGANMVYTTTVATPSWGWRAFLLELTWNYGTHLFGQEYMRVTTEVIVVPDKNPFPPCGDHCQ